MGYDRYASKSDKVFFFREKKSHPKSSTFFLSLVFYRNSYISTFYSVKQFLGFFRKREFKISSSTYSKVKELPSSFSFQLLEIYWNEQNLIFEVVFLPIP